MSVRTCRRVLFVAFFFLAPAPFLVLTRASMPAAGYLVLAAASGSVVALEGGAGPAPLIVALFLAHALIFTVVDFAAAWVLARASRTLSPRARRIATLALVTAGIVVAMGWDVYRTPFGRRPHGNVLEALT